MDSAFLPLAARVKALGNPARKYLRTVERHGERLLARLEASGRLSHIHLDRTAPALAEDFERVAAAGREAEEKLVLLGTFYAVQLLHQNARALEQLAVDLAEKPDRSGAYSAFLERTAEEFSLLVSTYAGHVLRLVRTAETGPFVILNVAMTADGPLVAFRDRSPREIRDIYASLFTGGAWTQPRPVFVDNWRIEACPVNGPMVAARDQRESTHVHQGIGSGPRGRDAVRADRHRRARQRQYRGCQDTRS